MARQKVWYKIYNNDTLLATVKSKGLAYIVAQKFRELYGDDNITILQVLPKAISKKFIAFIKLINKQK